MASFSVDGSNAPVKSLRSSTRRQPRHLTVAVTGLAAADNPAPGVALARCLRQARAGRLRLVGLTFDHHATGAYAAGLIDEVFLVPSPAMGERSFVEALHEISRKAHVDVLIPALDPDVALCAAVRPRLDRMGVRTLVPAPAAIRHRAKHALPTLARGFDLGAPVTVTIVSRSSMAQAFRELRPPFFLKGAFADARLVATEEEALAAFDALVAQWGLPLLAQERVLGDEVNVLALFDRRSAVVGAVPMRKLGVTARGKGWAGITVSLPDVVERATALLASIKWIGPAELEMVRDPASGRVSLIEINPRFPAWTYLAAAAGQNLPDVAVKLALGARVAPFQAPRAGVLFCRSTRDYFGPYAQVTELLSARRVAPGGV